MCSGPKGPCIPLAHAHTPLDPRYRAGVSIPLGLSRIRPILPYRRPSESSSWPPPPEDPGPWFSIRPASLAEPKPLLECKKKALAIPIQEPIMSRTVPADRSSHSWLAGGWAGRRPFRPAALPLGQSQRLFRRCNKDPNRVVSPPKGFMGSASGGDGGDRFMGREERHKMGPAVLRYSLLAVLFSWAAPLGKKAGSPSEKLTIGKAEAHRLVKNGICNYRRV